MCGISKGLDNWRETSLRNISTEYSKNPQKLQKNWNLTKQKDLQKRAIYRDITSHTDGFKG